jgi:two-component system, sensor histidine kinase and response regulator
MFGAGCQDILYKIIRIYICDSPALLDRMRTALQNRDSEDLSKAAHALKSSSANLGATGLAGFCRIAEDVARLGSTEGTDGIIARIQEEYGKVRAALEGELGREI